MVPPDVAGYTFELGVRDVRKLHLRYLACVAHLLDPQELEDLISLEESTWIGKRG